MTLCFTKMRSVEGCHYLVVFEQGEMENPILLLKDFQIDALVKEWRRKK